MRHSPKQETALLAVILLLVTVGCSRKSAPAPVPLAVPVTVARVLAKTVPVEVRAIGNVQAYSTVAIKAQVSGQLMAVHFSEGQDVKQGDLLFAIDRRPFEVALQQAEANLARDEARAENARAQAQRYAMLLQEGVASKEQYDQVRAEANALDAAVRADRAAMEKAKLDLEYCTIYSPMNGRTGSLVVHAGNLVKANENPALVVINQINPIYVNFSIPEQYLPEIKKYMAAGKPKVTATIPDERQRPEQGVLSFVDNAVDSTTGTIRLKATLANKEKRLWPGQFVDVVLTLTEQPRTTVVPAQAVQTGQTGQYVFIVKPDQTAEMRPVITGRSVGGETVIEKGLQPGETVVTDGQLRLVPGVKVEVKSSPQGS